MQCTHPTLFTQWFLCWVVYERSGNWVFTVWEFMTGRVRGWKRIGRKLQHAELNNFFQWKHTSTPSSHRQGVELLPLKKTQILIVESLHFEFLILYFLHFLSGREVQCSPTFCVCVCKAAKGQGLQCWIKKFRVAAPPPQVTHAVHGSSGANQKTA